MDDPRQIAEFQEVQVMFRDVRTSMFYLFEIPSVWAPYMAFGRGLPASVFGRTDPQLLHLCSRVIGMGWSSSVSIAQHLARRLALLPPLSEVAYLLSKKSGETSPFLTELLGVSAPSGKSTWTILRPCEMPRAVRSVSTAILPNGSSSSGVLTSRGAFQSSRRKRSGANKQEWSSAAA